MFEPGVWWWVMCAADTCVSLSWWFTHSFPDPPFGSNESLMFKSSFYNMFC